MGGGKARPYMPRWVVLLAALLAVIAASAWAPAAEGSVHSRSFVPARIKRKAASGGFITKHQRAKKDNPNAHNLKIKSKKHFAAKHNHAVASG